MDSGDGLPTSAGVKVSATAYYVVGLVAGYAVDLVVDLEPPLPSWLRTGAAVLVVAGGAMLLAALLSLLRAGTAIDPMRPTTVLLTRGVYRFTRNPAYLGWSIVYVGFALKGGSLAGLLLLPATIALVQHFVIQREEAYLHQAFGAVYDDYCRKVGRWL